MRSFTFIFPIATVVILASAFSTSLFTIPPLGKLLNPWTGVIQNERESLTHVGDRLMDIKDAHRSAEVFFDERRVPHIYASTDEAMYWMQGYMSGRLRLWQMDFMSYASAGRLSEIFADGFFEYDRRQRRIGMLESAKRSLELIEKDTQSLGALNAYTAGVNAYIAQLAWKDYPLEYKLLDYRPERWTNLKTVLIMKYMANMLAGYEEDLNMTNLMLVLGEQKFNKYFPSFPFRFSPVVKDSLARVNPDLAETRKPAYLDYSFLANGSMVGTGTYNPNLGSNSWVVSGKKTKSGHSILCNDPHLGLSLPAIWLEMQMTSPGCNVYGVAIPGVPSIIIGFNEAIAWGLTNGDEDVRDWYKLKLTDDYKKYEFEGKWVDLGISIEEIKRRGKAPFRDTIYHTIQGPIVNSKNWPGERSEPLNHALRWELHTPSNEIATFIGLNHARNYEDYRMAISHYKCPIQNFTFACKDNTIAISHMGSMAIKWPGQGKFILDGTRKDHLYSGYIPVDSLPHLVDPSCGFVFSANQHPTDNTYSYYYNGSYPEDRANRISELLTRGDSFDIAGMEKMQLDNKSTFAADALPVLTSRLARLHLNEEENSLLLGLKSWGATYDRSDTSAQLYNLLWKNIKNYTWDEFRGYSFRSKLPDDQVLLDLLRNEPENEYFDRQGTTARENADDILQEAFRDAIKEYDKQRKTTGVRWGDLNKVNINHLLNINQLGRRGIASAGYPLAINALSGGWGPSWRMIVELGERPVAFGIYPGGESGNPGSPYYDCFVDDWSKGKYYPLVFFMTREEARKRAIGHWVLK